MSFYCSFCKNNTDHRMKNKEGKTTCPVLLNVFCHQCKQKGHTPKCCPGLFATESFPALTEKVEKSVAAIAEPTEPTASTWATIAVQKRDTKLVAKISEDDQRILEETRQRQQKQAEEKKIRHKEWLKRKEDRERYEAEKKQREMQAHVEAMYEKYGTRWYVYVERTDDDCELAYQLREKEEDEACEREDRMRDAEREAIAQYEHKKATMTEEEFDEWMEEESEEYFDAGFREDSEFSCRACPAAVAFYNKTGLKRPAGDFVSTEWDAPLKPGIKRIFC